MHSSYQVRATFSVEHLLESFWVALSTHLRHMSAVTSPRQLKRPYTGLEVVWPTVVLWNAMFPVALEEREERRS
jgi:hypothetical protein